MSAPKMVTEREAVLRERAAYLKGAASQAVCSHKGPQCEMCRHAAAAEYPLPTVTRPRVVRHPHAASYEFKVGADGLIFERMNGGRWGAVTEWAVDRTLVQLWADLLDNPTEEVEEGA